MFDARGLISRPPRGASLGRCLQPKTCYDVIALAEAAGMDDLGKLVVARIQAVDGVTRTLTCPIIKL